jgi:hypothetical protein
MKAEGKFVKAAVLFATIALAVGGARAVFMI